MFTQLILEIDYHEINNNCCPSLTVIEFIYSSYVLKIDIVPAPQISPRPIYMQAQHFDASKIHKTPFLWANEEHIIKIIVIEIKCLP